MNRVLITSWVILLFGCSNQKTESEFILGKWTGESKVLVQGKDTLDYTKGQLGYTNNHVLIFNNDNTFIKDYSGLGAFTKPMNFTISQEFLILNGYDFTLISLNDSILILKDLPLLGGACFVFKYRKENP